jgi:SAM-dependent methyltransferase
MIPDLQGGRRRFSPGVVDHNASISAHYQTARALAPETAETWCALLPPFLTPFAVPTIVDLGCGTGRFSALLAQRFQARVTGVDPSLAMLNTAASPFHVEIRNGSSGPPCRYPVETDSNRGPVPFRLVNVHSQIALAWSKYR